MYKLNVKEKLYVLHSIVTKTCISNFQPDPTEEFTSKITGYDNPLMSYRNASTLFHEASGFTALFLTT